MQLIHRLKKLFTLKRSWNCAHSPLKHSWIYAETLLRSIYTCSFMYKRTGSWQLQDVNKFIFKNIKAIELSTLVFLLVCLMTSCSQVICMPKNQEHHLGINQKLATEIEPAQFYVCGDKHYPCSTAPNDCVVYAPVHHLLTSKENKHENPTK